MSISEAELASLNQVAETVREEVEASSHLVATAIELHPAFEETGDIAGAMVRRLVLHGARVGSQANALSPTSVRGGLDLVWSEEGLYRRYRIKKATRARSGSYEMMVGANSAIVASAEDNLIGDEQWVLGFTVSETWEIADLFVARVLGMIPGKVSRLHLGAPVPLAITPPTPPDRGFTSRTEDYLPGLDDEEAEGGSGEGTVA